MSEEDVIEDEEIHPPLAGEYRPSSLRLIDEAIAAAAAIEPSLFEPEELIAAGLMPPPSATTNPPRSAAAIPPPGAGADQGPVRSPDTAADRVARAAAVAGANHGAGAAANDSARAATDGDAGSSDSAGLEGVTEAQLGRVKITPRNVDPRISAARDLVELTPAVRNDPSEASKNGARTKIPSNPPLTAKKEPPPLAADDLDVPGGDFTMPLSSSAAPSSSVDEDSHGIPAQVEDDEDDDLSNEEQTDPARPPRKFVATVRRDDSQGLRMIGSHGRDRAEASGELRPMPVRATTADPVEPQRELVTILPRRITREIPIISPDALKAGANGDAKVSVEASALGNGKVGSEANALGNGKVGAEASALGNGKVGSGANVLGNGDAKVRVEVSALDDDDAEEDNNASAAVKSDASSSTQSAVSESAADDETTEAPAVAAPKFAKPAVEPPRVPAQRVSVAGGVRKSSGPGRGASILLVVGAVLLGATVFSVCHKKNPQRVATVTDDAAAMTVTPADANEYGGVDMDASTVATAPRDAGGRPDAAKVAAVRRDAGVALRDGGAAVASTTDAGVDKYAQAKALYEKAHAALEDGDPEQALELLDQSLALRPRALTYLEQARALQRMGRIDDAIAAVDRAIDANKTYAPAFEQKGMILWSAQRYDEARPVLEKYLEMDPNGRRAETIKNMLAESK